MILWRTVFCLLVATSTIFSPILSMRPRASRRVWGWYVGLVC